MGQERKKKPLNLCWLLYWKKDMTAGIAFGWRKKDLVELKQRYVSVINRVDLWNPIDNSIFIDQNPIDSYTSRKLCTSSWHVYLNSPLCLHNQKPCCGMIKHDSVPCNLIFPKIIRIAWGWSSQTMLTVGMKKIKIPSLPSHNPGKIYPQKFNGNWKKKWSENLAESTGFSEYPGADFQVKPPLHFTSYPIHIRWMMNQTFTNGEWFEITISIHLRKLLFTWRIIPFSQWLITMDHG